MAVSKKSDTDKTPTTGSSFTYASFNSTGTNPAIIVFIALDSTTAIVSSVIVNNGLTSGSPVELITKRDALGNQRTYCSIWAIPAPSGTGDIVVTLSASVPWQTNAILFEGADQTTPCPLGAGNVEALNSVTDTVLTSTLTNLTANDAAVVMGADAAAGDNPHVTTGTETWADNSTNVNMAAGFQLGTGAVAVTWGTLGDNVLLSARIVAAAGGGGGGAGTRSKSPLLAFQRGYLVTP